MLNDTREKCRFISLAATCALLFTGAGKAASLNFVTVNDPNAATDTPPFIQLLGINNSGTIVGYTGMGTPNPNRGIILTLPNSFTSLNPNINPTTCAVCQVQVFGIDGAGTITDGFFTDATGVTHGFVDVGNGTTATTVDDPLAPPANNQLLGLDQNGNEAAGFYTDSMGVTHGYTYAIMGGIFTSLPTGLANGPAVGEDSMATGINDAGMVAGFDMPSSTVSDGFLFDAGMYQAIQYPGSTFTQPLGLNDNGEIVGTYADAAGVMHGFIYLNGIYTSFDAPGATMMTTANGVNDLGDVVGFFMNASGATVGFEATPVPEPSTWMYLLSGTVVAFVAARRKPLRGR